MSKDGKITQKISNIIINNSSSIINVEPDKITTNINNDDSDSIMSFDLNYEHFYKEETSHENLTLIIEKKSKFLANFELVLNAIKYRLKRHYFSTKDLYYLF